jgi:MFS transporter
VNPGTYSEKITHYTVLRTIESAYGLGDIGGAAGVSPLVGGYVADRVQRRKLIAGLGYGISAVAKAGLLAAGTSVPALGAAIVADRAGKGLRTAPRDALITLSTPASDLGRAFGVHRAMDSPGAFAGPLVAIAVLAASGQAFDAVFVVSGCIAAIGVLVLVLVVRDDRDDSAKTAVDLRAVAALLKIALIQTGQALAYLVSSVLFGLAWSWWDAAGAIRFFAVAGMVTLGSSAALLLRTRGAAR